MLNVNGPAACGGNDTAVSHIKHRILPARIATVLNGASQPSAGFTVKVSGVCHHDGVLLQLVQRRLHFSPLVWWLVGHAEQRLEPFYTQKTRESWRTCRGEREWKRARQREGRRGRADGATGVVPSSACLPWNECTSPERAPLSLLRDVT